jgi:hypothetical protein
MSADWSLWADIPHTELWKAVALSMDIEPTKLPGYDRSSVRDPIFNYPFHKCPEEFKRRLDIAKTHLGHKLMPISFCQPDWQSQVDLLKMSCWATSLNNPWSFPDQFPKTTEALNLTSESNKSDESSFISDEKQSRSADQTTTAIVEMSNQKVASRGWFKDHAEHVIGTQRANKYSSAKGLYAGLENSARDGIGPFQIGEGDQRGLLVGKVSRRTLAYKSLANRWADIRQLAHAQVQTAP